MIHYEPTWKAYIVASTDPVFSKKECEDIIEMGNSLPFKDATIVGTGGSTTNHKWRKTDIAWIPFDRMPQVYERLFKWATRININCFGFDGLEMGEKAQFTKYTKNHHYDWHSDSAFTMKASPFVRKITMITMLSDPKDYTGGEFQIINDQKENTIRLKQGYAIFFASFIAHRVLPIKKGMKITMPIWFGGPPLR